MNGPLGINVRNVNHALPLAAMFFRQEQHVRRIAPRDPAKTTLEINVPVVTTYQNPRERVLFHPLRDANPFFHFFESLWILAGRDDVRWLSFFLERIKEYSDDGVLFHGAYGGRMRHVYSEFHSAHKDQLALLVEELRRDRNTRRAVLGIWQPDMDSGYTGKDMPCNCTVTFKLRDGVLHMTVFNRSNDMVWGAYGANVVQFSMLQEYVAAKVDAGVGMYSQWSDSFHVYENEPAWQRVRDIGLSNQPLDPYESAHVAHETLGFYENRPVRPYPLVKDASRWDTELARFMATTEHVMRPSEFAAKGIVEFDDTFNPFFTDVAVPLFNSFCAYKGKDIDTALRWALMCGAEDWSLGCASWLYRRRDAALLQKRSIDIAERSL